MFVVFFIVEISGCFFYMFLDFSFWIFLICIVVVYELFIGGLLVESFFLLMKVDFIGRLSYWCRLS